MFQVSSEGDYDIEITSSELMRDEEVQTRLGIAIFRRGSPEEGRAYVRFTLLTGEAAIEHGLREARIMIKKGFQAD
jgi:hypothetical protein